MDVTQFCPSGVDSEGRHLSKKSLLDLPLELLHIIISVLDAPSFSVLLTVSKSVRRRILSTNGPIHDQLRKLPGLHICSPSECLSKKPKDFLALFAQRAADHALNGVSVFADTVLFEQKDSMRPSLGQIARFVAAEGSTNLAAIAESGTGNIDVYSIRDGLPLHRCLISPEKLHLGQNIKFDVLQMRFHEYHMTSTIPLCVLYKYSIVNSEVENEKTYMRDASNQASNRLILVMYLIESPSHSRIHNIRHIKFHDSEYPVAIAVSLKGDAVIAFRVYPSNISDMPISGSGETNTSYVYRMRCYRPASSFEDVDPYCVSTCMRRNDIQGPDELLNLGLHSPIHDILYLGEKSLLVYCAGDHMSRYFIKNCTTFGNVLEELPQLQKHNYDTFFGSYRWLPLRTGHNHQCGTYEDGEVFCISTVLQLARLTTSSGRTGMYLVKGAAESEICYHLDLTAPLPSMGHVIVAQLMDVDFQPSISHGQIIAYSKTMKRIAIATWDRVQLFSIQPDAFMDPTKGSVRTCSPDLDENWPNRVISPIKHKLKNLSSEEHLPEDCAYTFRCGHGYYRSYIRLPDKSSRIVGLRPTELPNMGIVYSMKFTGDDILWAWTAKGLVKWYWGPGRKAKREVIMLRNDS